MLAFEVVAVAVFVIYLICFVLIFRPDVLPVLLSPCEDGTVLHSARYFNSISLS